MRAGLRMLDHNREKFGIILLNWNAEELTTRCVRALQEWHKLRPHIYVVDNGSSGTGLYFEDSRDVPISLIKSPKNRGYAGGNNLGIRKAIEDGCEYLVLLNSDAYISENNMEILLDQFRRYDDIGCLGPGICEGDLLFLGGRDMGLHSNTRNIMSQETSMKGIMYIDYVPGMVFLTTKDVIKRIGFLDEQFFFSGEIADFCKRVLKAGYRCAVCPDVRANHVVVEDNPLRSSLYAYYSFRNRFLFVRKHHSNIRWILEPFWILWGMHKYVRGVILGLDNESAAYRMAIMDGVRGVFGDRNDLFSV